MTAKSSKQFCCLSGDRQVRVEEICARFNIRSSGSARGKYAEICIPKTFRIAGNRDIQRVGDIKLLCGEDRLIHIVQNYFVGETESSRKEGHFSADPSGSEACQYCHIQLY